MTFSPAELSRQQIINIPKILKDFFARIIVVSANHQYPGNFLGFFFLQNCLSRKSSVSRKYSKTSPPAELSQQQFIKIPELFKDFFACRTVLAGSHRFPEIFKDFFAGRVVLAANHQYPEKFQRVFRLQNCLSANQQYPVNIQRLFRLQNCLSWKSSVSRNIQRLFRPHNCLSRKSSISRRISRSFSPAELSQRKLAVSRKYPKRFSPAELSYQQIINIPEFFREFFACRVVLAANHQYPGNIQSHFRLQNCLSRKSSIFRKYSKSFPPAELSQPQIINIPEKFKDFFACRITLAANHQYPGNIQRLLRLQNCLTSKSLISRNYSKTFLACRTVLAANHQYPENTQRLFRSHNCRISKSSISRKFSRIFFPAELSQPQIICIPKNFKEFFACRIVLAQISSIP